MENRGRSNRLLGYQFTPMLENGDITTMSSDVVRTPKSRQKTTLFKNWISKNLLLLATLLGVLAGVILGFVLRPLNPSATAILVISYPGELFMRLLKLIILPLIISSLVAGSASLNARLNGKIAVRTFVYFLITSFINAILGVVLAVSIRPGDPGIKAHFNNNIVSRRNGSVVDSLLDLGRNVIAENIFQATFQQAYTNYVNTTTAKLNSSTGQFDMTEVTVRQLDYRMGTNTLGMAFFCLTFGTILGTLGDKGKIVTDFFTVVFETIMKMVFIVMWLTPIGVCSVIIARILSVSDIALVMSQLGWFITTMVIGVFLYQLIIMQLIYVVFVRRNPFKYYVGLLQGMLTAFATASTAAALPITFRLMDDKLKVDPRISRFVLPIGCNINMDGTALFLAVSCIFIAQMNGTVLGIGELITVCVTATATSFSSASVPSAALALVIIVLSAIDTPHQDVSLLFAVDWLVDRFRTTNNMLGDCYAAAVVEKLSKMELMTCDSILEQSPTSNVNTDAEEPLQVIINDNHSTELLTPLKRQYEDMKMI